MSFRKSLWILGVIPILASCAPQRITLATVGPQPGPGAYSSNALGKGQLEVFTATEEYEFDQDVPFYPHSDYQIYTKDGKRLKRVWNHQDHEDETPAVVTLPAGQYVVKADAELYGLVTVPIVVRPNQLTKVILQPGWKPGTALAGNDVVRFPGGYPVGWRAQLPGTTAVPAP